MSTRQGTKYACFVGNRPVGEPTGP
jgi:hypothetical protein